MPIQSNGKTAVSSLSLSLTHTHTQHTQKMSKQPFKVCFCFWRYFGLKKVEPPEDVKRVFQAYSESGTMNIDNLHRFLTVFQGQVKATREDAQAILDSLKHLNVIQRKGLHLEAFFRYLFGDYNLPLSSSHGEVHHNMKAPLAHYFIYTGHNSYLTGNQWTSDCHVDPIIKALRNGVRVVELDLWPKSKNDDVEVRHGGTLTTPVDLIPCLEAIKENAFHASEYPVVITFEDHLNTDLRKKVAQMVTKTFGEMLFHPDIDFEELPSPESLKRKIIISTKPPKEYLESQVDNVENLHEVNNGLAEEEHRTTCKEGSNEGEDYQDEDVQEEVPEYRSLIAIHAVKLKGNIENWLYIDSDKVKRLSLSEQELEDAAKRHGSQIVRFTQRNLLRVYPKGTRLDSSNYNPFVGWMHGAQMVAFNMQGYGKNLWRMQGMFRANGGCGYVKKPDILLNGGLKGKVFNPSEKLRVKTTLKVKVYLGEGWHFDFHHTHFDKCSPPDFYTRVGIAGVPDDSVMKETKSIEDDWTPMWNTEFEFSLTVPELALLRVEVMEQDVTKKNDFGGQTCLPVLELRRGIRCVPLHDKKGEKYPSVKLLMSFEFV